MENRVFGAYADSDSEGPDQIRAFLSGPSQSSRFTDYCRIYTVDSRYLDFAYLEILLISKWNLVPVLTWKSNNR